MFSCLKIHVSPRQKVLLVEINTTVITVSESIQSLDNWDGLESLLQVMLISFSRREGLFRSQVSGIFGFSRSDYLDD